MAWTDGDTQALWAGLTGGAVLPPKGTEHRFTRIHLGTSIESRCSCGAAHVTAGTDHSARSEVMAWESEHKAATL